MRIKVGMKVEALITEAASNIGAWRAGEVVWGNGHSYVMRWSDGGPDSERILRKFVRPSPPDDPDVVPLPEDLGAGDIVELFDGSLWKWVEVVRVGGRQLDVKFVGSTRVVTADRSALRPRLIYGEKGWALIHKNDQIPIESAVPSRPIAGKNIKSKATSNGIGNGASEFAAQAVKLGKTKRGNYAMEADIVRDVKRFRGNGDTNRVFVKPEEPAARYDDNMEVMDVHPSHYLEKRQETGNNVDCFLVRRTENDKDDDDDVSSTSDTSSSSASDSSTTSSSSSSSGSNNNGGDRGASAEYCQENQEADIPRLPKCKEEEQDTDRRTASARMQHLPMVNEVKVAMKEEEPHDQSVHGLELEAYMSVMKVFHATGQLTWTKEELLCDLRLHLHVSSDEHMQLIWRLNGKKKPADGPHNGHC